MQIHRQQAGTRPSPPHSPRRPATAHVRPCPWRRRQHEQRAVYELPRTPYKSRLSVVAQGVTFEGAIPEGVEIEVKGPQEGVDVDWNPDTKTLRLPYSIIEQSGERRTKLVIFTCNKCGGRTARNVNPIAWEKGLVMGQCATCEVWHVLSAKNPLIYEEIRYKDEPSVNADSSDATSVDHGSSVSSTVEGPIDDVSSEMSNTSATGK